MFNNHLLYKLTIMNVKYQDESLNKTVELPESFPFRPVQTQS